MYKNLTPEEKATWVTRAEEDKMRYEREIAEYIPPPGHDSRGNLIEEQRPRKRNKRAPKDPDAPKRASGAYVFFTNEMRPIVMKQFPGIKFVEMGRILGERWRALTSEEKSRYEKLAQEDKIRFQYEMQQYTATQAAQQQQQQAFAQAQAQAQAVAVGAQAAHTMVTAATTHPTQFHGVQAPTSMAPTIPHSNPSVYMDPHQAYYQHETQSYDATKYGQLPTHQFQ